MHMGEEAIDLLRKTGLPLGRFLGGQDPRHDLGVDPGGGVGDDRFLQASHADPMCLGNLRQGLVVQFKIQLFLGDPDGVGGDLKGGVPGLVGFAVLARCVGAGARRWQDWVR